MNFLMFKRFIIVVGIGVYCPCVLPMEQKQPQKKLWLDTLYQEYKKMNYKRETTFMKEELGLRAYNLDIRPREKEYMPIAQAYFEVQNKHTNFFISTLCVLLFFYNQDLFFAQFMLFVFSFFYAHLKEDNKEALSTYGSLLLEEIKKKEFHEKLKKLQHNKK